MFTDEQKAWMVEAEKRGVLSDEQKNYLQEARKRGLIEAPEQPAPQGGFFDGVTDAARQGLSFGWGDDINAAGRVVGDYIGDAIGGVLGVETKPSGTFEQYQKEAQGELDAFREQNPVTATVAEGVGGAITGGKAVQAGAQMLGNAGRTFVGKMPAPVRYGVPSGAGGAIYGAGENNEDRADGALAGGSFGLVLGALAPYAGKMAGWSTQKIVDTVNTKLRGQGRSLAQRQIQKALLDSGYDITNADGVAKLNRDLKAKGGEAGLIDVGDPVARRARGARTSNATAAQRLNDFISNRQEGMGQRLLDSVNKNVSDKRFFDAMDEVLTARKNAATQQYGALYEREIPLTPELNDIFDRLNKSGATKRIFEDIQERLPLEGDDLPQIFVRNGDEITLDVQRIPNMKVWDHIKQSLDEVLDSSAYKNDRGAINRKGRSIANLRSRLKAELDGITDGEYAQARGVYAGYSATAEALENGKKFLRGDLEDFEQVIKEMGDTELEAFRVGVARELRNKIMKKSDTANAARVFGNADIRERLQKVLSPEEYDALQKRIDAEWGKFTTGQSVVSNSQTVDKLVELQEQGTDPMAAIGMVADFASGVPVNMSNRLAHALINKFSGPDPRVAKELSEYLGTADRSKIAELLRATQNQRKVMGPRRDLARALGQGAVAGSLTAPDY